MKIKTISVEYKRKFNLGDYNSADLACTLWADLEENEDLQQVLQELSCIARDNVKERALPLVGRITNDNFKQMFQGLPIELQQIIERSDVNVN